MRDFIRIFSKNRLILRKLSPICETHLFCIEKKFLRVYNENTRRDLK